MRSTTPGPNGCPEAVAAGMTTLDAFLEALNRRDDAGLNAAFNFPHVRIASGRVVTFPNRGDYTFEGFAARAGDGWNETRWDDRTVIHAHPDKVHFAVQFSRWRADGSLIGRYQSIWIVTNQDGHWGVQARSSFAS